MAKKHLTDNKQDKPIFSHETSITNIKKNNTVMRNAKKQDCEFCLKPNYYTEKKCEHCLNSINKRVTSPLGSKIINWVCTHCNKMNKTEKNYCENCRMNKTNYITNEKDIKVVESKINHDYGKALDDRMSARQGKCIYCSRQSNKRFCDECCKSRRLCHDCFSSNIQRGEIYCESCIRKKNRQTNNTITVNPLTYELKNHVRQSIADVNKMTLSSSMRRGMSSDTGTRLTNSNHIAQSGQYRQNERDNCIFINVR